MNLWRFINDSYTIHNINFIKLRNGDSHVIRHVNRQRFVIKPLDESPAIRLRFVGLAVLFESQNNMFPQHKKRS